MRSIENIPRFQESSMDSVPQWRWVRTTSEATGWLDFDSHWLVVLGYNNDDGHSCKWYANRSITHDYKPYLLSTSVRDMVVREHLRASRLLWPHSCPSTVFYSPLRVLWHTRKHERVPISLGFILYPSCSHLLPFTQDACAHTILITVIPISTFYSLWYPFTFSLLRCARHADYAPLCHVMTF